MAFRLGQAIVEFRAKGVNDVTMAATKATRSLKDMVRAATGFSVALSAGAVTAAAVAMVKLAANTEVTKTQFSVLLKDMDAAESLLRDITELAASTPFQKMELADAGRMLLAFGIGADDVVNKLRQIGDISALTGNSIGEIAEIYGKARVQGRLFAEDINQLTGRGIPIIEELAQQFGVSTEQVKSLVSEGRVGFPQLEAAFASMTSQGGLFADGMDRLSQTTAGKLSTLKDQLTEIGVTIGNDIMPAVTELVDYLSFELGPDGELRQNLKGFLTDLSDIGALWKNLNLNPFDAVLIDFNEIERQELANLQEKQERQNQRLRDKFAAKARQEKAPAVVAGKLAAQQEDAIAEEQAQAIERAVRSQSFGFSELASNVQQSALSQQIQLAEQTNDHLEEVINQQVETNNLLKDGIKQGGMVMQLG